MGGIDIGNDIEGIVTGGIDIPGTVIGGIVGLPGTDMWIGGLAILNGSAVPDISLRILQVPEQSFPYCITQSLPEK